MPRDGSGVYSKPSGTTAVTSTTIESAKYNSTIDDLVTDANTARPVVAGGTGQTSALAAMNAFGAADASVSGDWTISGAWTFSATATFQDSVKAIFGTGGDLEIYHNGTNSFIQDVGTGTLFIDSNGAGVHIRDTSSGTATMGFFRTGGAFEAYHNGSKTLETKSGGAIVTGDLVASTVSGAWIASQAEAEAGTAANKIMTPQRVAQAIAELAEPEFTSAGNSYTAGALLTIAHGLGAIPNRVKSKMVCTTNDAPFTAGQVLFNIPTFQVDAGLEHGATIWADATNIYVRIGANGIQVHNASGAGVTLDQNDWTLTFQAWA